MEKQEKKDVSKMQKTKIQSHSKYTVSVRIRPNLNSGQQSVFIPHQAKYVKQLKTKSIVTYGFDNVFDDTYTNEQIFQQSIKGVVKHYLQNKISTTILAYGQTGSGKTYTLFGHNNSKNLTQKGLAFYIAQEIMTYSQEKKVVVSCTFLQIYKQKVTDLLQGNQVSLRDNQKGQLVLDNHNVEEVKTKQEMMNLFMKANQNKIFGNSYVHSQSSRSHVMFIIQINGVKLNIVDLCGSEVLTYQFDSKQRQETNSINLSLFTLNSVVSDLCDKNKREDSNKFIPFRNSVLTRLLKSSLINQKKTQIYLFCNISAQKKHQQFSSSTLRFGQIAIKIDDNQDYQEEKVNLSQQKRQMKKVSNIIEIVPKPNTTYAKLPQPWETSFVKIFGKKTLIYKLQANKQNSQLPLVNVLFLHAYGGGCDGQDLQIFAAYISHHFGQKANCNLYSVDFPGFGNSQGQKFTSRAQKFQQKQQPLDFMLQLIKIFGFNKKNRKVILMGYDLGGAISLRCSYQSKLADYISGIILFHPTWTDKMEKLALINIPVLLLWFSNQTFHLISAGQKMAKIIKNAVLYKYNTGPYKSDQSFYKYSHQMSQKIIEFIQGQEAFTALQQRNINQAKKNRGKIVQQQIVFNLSKQEEKIILYQNAVKQVYAHISQNKEQKIFDSIIKGGENKPKYLRLASDLPDINMDITWNKLLQYKIFQDKPKNIELMNQQPFFKIGRQIHIKTKICLNALKQASQYLSYDQNGQIGLTHKAQVSADQTQSDILESQKLKVTVQTVKSSNQLKNFKQILVDLDDAIYLNSKTLFKKNQLGHYIFQDSVTCKYDSNIVKLILLKCCFKIKKIVQSMDFSQQQNILEAQKQCTKSIFQVMDLRHLVHQGIDNTRFTGTDVGRLAYYGQGNCHHLASVLAALLLPFGNLLGWDVIFRAGSFFMTGRQIDELGQPLPGWNGKPKVNVQDHTWLQIVYRPSYKVFVFDPSFSICNQELNTIYSYNGKMHISGKPLNFALNPSLPDKLFQK